MSESTSILLCTAVRGGISPSYEMSADALARWCHVQTIPFAKRRVAELPIDAARNLLAAEFLKATYGPDKKPFKYCLMIDAGVGFPLDVIQRLIAADEDFTAAAVPLRDTQLTKVAERGDAKWAASFALALANDAFTEDGKVKVVDKNGGQFVSASRIGAACLCLKRNVFETIARAWPEIHHKDGVAYFKPDLFDENNDTLTRRMTRAIIQWANDNGADPSTLLRALDVKPEEFAACGEDTSFVRRWLATGGKIWLAANAPMIHEGHGYWTGNFANLLD